MTLFAQSISTFSSIPTLVIGGSHSGVGKTSVAVGMMRALSDQGLTVQPFKVGPDFIDPGHHYRATGRVSHNLDGWMLTRSQNLALFRQACEGADIAVVEGVMGLFDGYGAESEAGSTAEMAKWLGAPVLLVINARALGRSAAALIYGYIQFDPDLRVAGIICNRIGGPSHLERIGAAVSASLPKLSASLVLAGLPRSELAAIPERHLGLWLAMEDNLDATYINTLADLVRNHIDVQHLLNLAQEHSTHGPHGSSAAHLSAPDPCVANAYRDKGDRPQPVATPPLLPRSIPSNLPTTAANKVRIGVARDRAFCFYYAINLTLLEQAGAELVEFSPLLDNLPPDLDGLYLGGGYPELHREVLSDNLAMRKAIASLCQSGHPVYAECGGLMYLSQGLRGNDGQLYPFVGVLPFWTQMGTRVKLGYRQVDVLDHSALWPAGATIRGHRFHYSDIVDSQGNTLTTSEAIAALNPSIQLQYRLTGWGDRQELEGYGIHNVIASYVHLHFGSNPAFPRRFVKRCRDLR